MKLTGDLKKKVEAAESRDEARKHIADAGMELTDDELEKVAGRNWQEYRLGRRHPAGSSLNA